MKISIITINYNNKEGLAKTLQSVINQTYQDIEYLIIDGGSSDGSGAILKQNESKISHWVSEKDTGIYNAMNKGIAKATGAYLLFLNSGDELADNTVIETLLREPLLTDFIYGDLLLINENQSQELVFPEKLSFGFFRHHSLPHPATLIKRSCFSLIGTYDENLKIVSDWKFFLLAICKYNCTYQYRKGIVAKFYEGGVSSLPQNMDKIVKEREQVLLEDFAVYLDDYKKMEELSVRIYRARYLIKVDRMIRKIFFNPKR